MPFCTQSCTLWDIRQITKRHLEKLKKVREDLEDLHHNEPAVRETTRMKIVIIDTKINESKLRAQRLQHCLDNGCDICFPESGISFE